LEEWTRAFSRGQQCSRFRITVFYGVRAGDQKVWEWGPKIWKKTIGVPIVTNLPRLYTTSTEIFF